MLAVADLARAVEVAMAVARETVRVGAVEAGKAAVETGEAARAPVARAAVATVVATVVAVTVAEMEVELELEVGAKARGVAVTAKAAGAGRGRHAVRNPHNPFLCVE